MGRGRGKGRRPSTTVADHDDTASGEDEKLPKRRRGRPLKPIKGNIKEEDKVVKMEEEEQVEEAKNSPLSKRKRPSLVNENADISKEENGTGYKSSTTSELVNPVGYRQNGSRRKNKPRRAAEVGVECK